MGCANLIWTLRQKEEPNYFGPISRESLTEAGDGYVFAALGTDRRTAAERAVKLSNGGGPAVLEKVCWP